MRLAPYNSLPPRPEYTQKVVACLSDGKDWTAFNLCKATGLTKTQVLCTLEQLIASEKISTKENPKRFSLVL